MTHGNPTLTTVNISAPDPAGLARFYQGLLGGELLVEEPGWVMLAPERSGSRLSFQTEQVFTPPVWPPVDGRQQMMMHLEVRVDDLEAGVAHALSLGATLAEQQPQDDVRVCLDPAGHPFCLWVVT